MESARWPAKSRRSSSLSSSNKARVSSSRPPGRARVVRSGGSHRRKGGGGAGRFFSGPVGAVIVGVLLVMGIGYAVKQYKPEAAPADAKVSAPGTQAQAPAPTTPAPSTPTAPATGGTTPAPITSTPAPQPPPANQAADNRSHIDRSAGAARKSTVTIYYTDGLKGGQSLQPVEVQIPHTTGWIRAIAEQVVNPPTQLKLYSGIPAGTTVQSVDLKGDTAVIDLSPHAKGVTSASDASAIKAAFVYSLTELKDVKSVLVWINGFPAQFGQMVWDKPVTRAELEAQNLFKVEPVIKFQ